MPRRLIVFGLSLVVAAGLAVDAYVHLHLASGYAMVRTNVVSQAALFRIEGIAAIVAAVAVVARPNRWTALLAFVIAVGGVAAVLVYTNIDPGRLGPLPDMYEPLWYTDKTNSLIGEAVAAATAAVLLFLVAKPRSLTRVENS